MTALLFRTVVVIHRTAVMLSLSRGLLSRITDSAFRKQHSPFAHLLSYTLCAPLKEKRSLQVLLSVTVVLREIEDNEYIQNVWGANKVYYGRCANGDWNQVPFVRSGCCCGCERDGSDIKRNRKAFCFIICHLGKNKKSKWHFSATLSCS